MSSRRTEKTLSLEEVSKAIEANQESIVSNKSLHEQVLQAYAIALLLKDEPLRKQWFSNTPKVIH